MRRSWIKLYTDILRSSTLIELNPTERWIWVGLLAAAGDSAYDGVICFTESIGYTDEQMAEMLKVSMEAWLGAKIKLASDEVDKITVDGKNIIVINKWHLYQSEYQRQKPYREAKKLLPKVTNKSYSKSDKPKLLLDRDKDRDKEIDKDIIINKEDFKNLFYKKYRNLIRWSYDNEELEIYRIAEHGIPYEHIDDLCIMYPELTLEIFKQEHEAMNKYLRAHPDKTEREEWTGFILHWMDKYFKKQLIQGITSRLAGKFSEGGK